jgi:hypothetical protein
MKKKKRNDLQPGLHWENIFYVNRALTSLLITAVLASCTSCSLLVAQGGKDIDKVFVSEKSQRDIQKALGCPTSTITYPQPVPAAAIPELSQRLQWSHPFSTNHLKLKNAMIASHADYAYRGWISDRSQRAGWSMGVEMIVLPTLGLGELFLFPYSIYWAVGESFRVHHFRVWYGADRNYVAHITLPELTKPKAREDCPH